MELKELIRASLEARQAIKTIDEKYDAEILPYKEAKKEIDEIITKMLNERGELSSRTEIGTVTLSKRKTAKIVDEQKLVEELKKKGLNDYVEERVNEIFKEGALKEQAKQGAELLPGIEVQVTDYLSVKGA